MKQLIWIGVDMEQVDRGYVIAYNRVMTAGDALLYHMDDNTSSCKEEDKSNSKRRHGYTDQHLGER